MLFNAPILTELRNMASQKFRLTDLPEFPYTEYTEMQAKYLELEQWYNGKALGITQEQGGKSVELYPLHINLIHSAVAKHAYALWGEYPDDASASLVRFNGVIREENDRESVNRIEDILYDVWYDNNGASMQMEQAILSQIYGGCVFKVAWTPNGDQKVRLERVHPREFIGIPYSTNYWSLRKAWIVREISSETAESYGVKIGGTKGYYIEYWTPDEYQILINDAPINIVVMGQQTIAGGDNPFGFVPFVYIPHERSGDFYGVSLITDASIGITKELNLRAADAGDAASDQSHSVLAMKNVRGLPQIARLSNGLQVVNLASAQTISGGEDPDLFSVNRSSISESMLNLVDELHDEFRREVFVPAVAEGEDEGSQRSAATLQARMWPLTSHIKSERANWTTGLIIINRMILKILNKKEEISDNVDNIHMKIKWYPVLPRERQAFIEELVSRAGANIGSLEHLLELVGDVDDIELEMEQIKDYLEFKSGLTKPAVPPGGAAPQPNINEPGRTKKTSAA